MKVSKQRVAGSLVKAHSEVAPRRPAPRLLMRAHSQALPGRGARRAALRVSRSIGASLRDVSRVHHFMQAVFMGALLFIACVVVRGTPVGGRNGERGGIRGGVRSVTRARIEAIRATLRAEGRKMVAKQSLMLKMRRRRNVTKKQVLAKVKRTPAVMSYPRVRDVGNMQRIRVGTFPDARKIGIYRIAVLNANASRFDVPWLLLPRVETKSFQDSGHRILYSTMKVKSSDGIGHGMTVLNAELSAALSLGISYTHRIGVYGSISMENEYAVENIFGWGVGEVPRRFIEKEVCDIELKSRQGFLEDNRKCPVCKALRTDLSLPLVHITEIPDNLLYGCVSCHDRQREVGKFLLSHPTNRTLFQMSSKKCDVSPKSPDFTLSYHLLYWKYWDLHGNEEHGKLPMKPREIAGKKWAPPVRKRDSVRLAQNELNIAIHARRGDFFVAKKRRMISSKVFAATVRNAMAAVKEVGGVFARMPVAVLVYSEGRQIDTERSSHDRSNMDRVYVDDDGSVRNANWFHRLVVPGLDIEDENETHSAREKAESFPHGIRVEFRIATPVNESIHEMASADIFIGSPSDFSQYAVRVISRGGAQLLPQYSGAIRECCSTRFNEITGDIRSTKRFAEFWRMYVIANEASAVRAMNGVMVEPDATLDLEEPVDSGP